MSRAHFWMLSRLLPRSERDVILGDLLEEQAQRLPNERFWFLSQIARSLLPLLWLVLRRGRWVATLGAGLAAYGVVKVAESLTTLFWPLLPVALSRNSILIAVVGFSTMALGGYLAAWIRSGAALILAVLSTLMVLQWMSSAGTAVPFPWQLYFLLSCPAAALAGGFLLHYTGRRRAG